MAQSQAQPLRLNKAAAQSALPSTSSSSSAAASSSSSSHPNPSDPHTKNVVVLGGSYGGMHAAAVLAQKLPPSHRVILIERNSHFNHLYVFPRFSVLPGHEHKAFIPYTSIFKNAPARPKSHQKRGRTNQSTNKSHAQRPSQSSKSHAVTSNASSSSLATGAPVAPRKCASSPTMSDVPEGEMLDESTAAVSPAWDEISDRSESPSSSRARSRDSRHSSRTSLSTAASSADTDLSGSSYDAASTVTAASSYISTQDERHAKVAGPSGVEAELAHTAEKARQEEKLGRPEIQVTELGEAVENGLDLDGHEAEAEFNDAEDQDDVAEGFESSAPHIVLQATVTDITPTHVTVTPSTSSDVYSQFSSKKKSLWSIDSVQIPYSHLIYALGSHLPDPLRTEARLKRDGMSWMREMQERVKASHEIVLVGGGALGIEFATDIASVYPHKDITLIHSRKQLLPNFDERVHEIAYHRLKQLGVNVVLGERLALTEGCPRGSTVKDSSASASASAGAGGAPAAQAVKKMPDVCVTGDAKGEGVQAHQEGMCIGGGKKVVRTTGGKSFSCDLLLLCTGQQPNSSLMAKLSPSSVDPGSRLVRVHRTLQVSVPDPRDAAQQPFDAKPPCGDCDCFLDKKAHGAELHGDEQGHLEQHLAAGHVSGKLGNVYAIGDVADAFGALNAGYQAWNMADVATENILRDIEARALSSSVREASQSRPASPSAGVEYKHFEPCVNMLKLSLGLGKMVFQGPVVANDHDGDGDGGGSLRSPEETGYLTQEQEAKKELVVNGRIPGRPEITIKDDPEDLGVEGVWTFMASADTSDMYL
ncbi:hypothetical protein BCV70DRAFT_213617 [Testicularia cyperi]|uniref:FAD/NAD(P)-binding domain-containing protein n=1 Tax=Testicularia cyperi TaxID=1882483 RepID=A0A317XHZ6_9BASI|nr:hypothetical protein BCV70DRAFT_213617 [Testicularia cyperi]